MQRVLVMDTHRMPLMPCHPARARELLAKGKAAILRLYPFTIILKYAVLPNNQPVVAKVDTGSKITGVVLVADFLQGKTAIWAAEIVHRSQAVRKALLARRQTRKNRRSRKTRYRPARFENRRRAEGWLPPSLESRIQNIMTWVERLHRWTPLTSLSVERVKFDTQLMQNAEIKGVEYRQSELQGYEVREYLLEKWGRRCSYCGVRDVPLQAEHLIPKSRGGSDRVSNLTLACEPCNQRKGKQTATEFGFSHLQARAQQPLMDAAAVNSSCDALYQRLETSGLAIETGTGGRTKFNRTLQGYAKTHWIDAACVGESGTQVRLDPQMQILYIRASGRELRQMCRMDKFGFPRTKAKQQRQVRGFQTGDLVKAIVPAGKYVGVHLGRVAVRATGNFRVSHVDGISWKYCRLLQAADGYDYQLSERSKGAILSYV